MVGPGQACLSHSSLGTQKTMMTLNTGKNAPMVLSPSTFDLKVQTATFVLASLGHLSMTPGDRAHLTVLFRKPWEGLAGSAKQPLTGGPGFLPAFSCHSSLDLSAGLRICIQQRCATENKTDVTQAYRSPDYSLRSQILCFTNAFLGF